MHKSPPNRIYRLYASGVVEQLVADCAAGNRYVKKFFCHLNPLETSVENAQTSANVPSVA